jgi:hypothetical protein
MRLQEFIIDAQTITFETVHSILLDLIILDMKCTDLFSNGSICQVCPHVEDAEYATNLYISDYADYIDLPQVIAFEIRDESTVLIQYYW